MAVVGSLTQAALAKSALHASQELYEDSKSKTGSLTAPLLQGKDSLLQVNNGRATNGGSSQSSGDDTEAGKGKAQTGAAQKSGKGQKQSGDSNKRKVSVVVKQLCSVAFTLQVYIMFA